MADLIQYRRDMSAAWTAANPILAQGEPALELDTGLKKIGDGVTPWDSLAYEASGGGGQGPKGDRGDQGPQGPQGPKGDKGDKGDPGSGGASTPATVHTLGVVKVGPGINVGDDGAINLIEVYEDNSSDTPTGVLSYPAPVLSAGTTISRFDVWGSKAGVGDLITDSSDPNYGKYKLEFAGFGNSDVESTISISPSKFSQGSTNITVNYIGQVVSSQASTIRLTNNTQANAIDLLGAYKIVVNNNTVGAKEISIGMYDSEYKLIQMSGYATAGTEILLNPNTKYLFANIRYADERTIAAADLGANDFTVTAYKATTTAVETFDSSIFVQGGLAVTATYLGQPLGFGTATTTRISTKVASLVDISAYDALVFKINDLTLQPAIMFADERKYLSHVSQDSWITYSDYMIIRPPGAHYLIMNVRHPGDTPITPSDIGPTSMSIKGLTKAGINKVYMPAPLYDGSRYSMTNVKVSEEQIDVLTQNKPARLYIGNITNNANFDANQKRFDLRIGCLGSSTTAKSLNANGTDNFTVNYPSKLGGMLGATIYNYGLSGSTVSDKWANSFIARVDTMENDLDIVIFQGAGNDHKNTGYVLGQMGDTSTATYYGACNVLINKLKIKYPNAMLVCITSPASTIAPLPTESGKAAMNAWIDVARSFDIPVFDIYRSVDEFAAQIGVNMPDGSHMNIAGLDVYSALIAHGLRYLLQRSPQTRERIKYTTHDDVLKMIQSYMAELNL